jgi:transposase
MKHDRYTVTQFNQQFPNDAACLDYIFDQRHPDGGLCAGCGRQNTFYRVGTRRCYSCANCGHQIHPCEGTIFHKSSTKLKTWFYAMFLMTASKNGVSAKELERLTGVTYKTAWRMAHQIRKLMNQGGDLLSGVVEADETYVGGEIKGQARRFENKTIVAGIVEREGEIRAKVVTNVRAATLLPYIARNVKHGSTVHTDENTSYNKLRKFGYVHATVEHGRKEYVRAEVHTNSVEGFWSQLKRSVNGTFHQVSRDHLQAYVNEFCFRYNHRASVTEAPIFPRLVEKVGEKRD